MSLAQDITILKKIPMFSEFQDDQLRMLAFSAERLDYGAGQRLFAQTDRAGGGHVINERLVSDRSRVE